MNHMCTSMYDIKFESATFVCTGTVQYWIDILKNERTPLLTKFPKYVPHVISLMKETERNHINLVLLF